MVCPRFLLVQPDLDLLFFHTLLALESLLEILDTLSLAESMLAPKLLLDESLVEENGEADQDALEGVKDVNPALTSEGMSITHTHRVSNHYAGEDNEADFVVDFYPVAQV